MKSLVFYGPGNYKVEQRPLPQITDGEALLKVLACGLCGTDVKIFDNGHRAITPPRTTGHEIVGEITESKTPLHVKGERVAVVTPVGCMNCKYCARGEQNMCSLVAKDVHSIGYYTDGGFAEYMRVPKEAVAQGALIKIPETKLPVAALALIEPLSCVINGQEKLKISSNDTVVILGAGPIGSMHALLARARGAKKIIIDDIEPKKLKLAGRIPADVFVDASKEDIVSRVRTETGGEGADVVVVASPSGEAQAQAVQMAGIRARISFFGGLAKGTSPPQIDTNSIHYNEHEIYGAFASNRRQYEKAMRLILDAKINHDLLITHTFPLEEIDEAVEIMKSGEALKVVIVP